MAELLTAFETPLRDNGNSYHARAVGRRADDGMWEGWLEFVPVGSGGEVLVGNVESRQPERVHLEYWATGLSPVYLEGALKRAKHPLSVRVRVAPTPVSSEPAPRPKATPIAPPVEAVLDPFEVARRSVDILRQELTALNRPRLLNLITAYDLNPGNEPMAWMTDAQLTRFIVVAVETRLAQRVR